MAFTTQVIEEGYRNYIIKVDGTAAESASLLVDVSTLNPPCTSIRLKKISYNIADAALMTLLWDATVPTTLLTLNGGNDADMCFTDTAGIPNNAGAGKTGDVLLTTASTTPYTLYLEFIKSNPIFPL